MESTAGPVAVRSEAEWVSNRMISYTHLGKTQGQRAIVNSYVSELLENSSGTVQKSETPAETLCWGRKYSVWTKFHAAGSQMSGLRARVFPSDWRIGAFVKKGSGTGDTTNFYKYTWWIKSWKTIAVFLATWRIPL